MSAVDYAAVKVAVKQWVTDVVGPQLGADANGDPFIFWFEDAHPNQGEPHASLTLRDGGRQGRDAVTWVEDVPNRTLAPRVRGNRHVVVGVTVRSRGDANIPRDVVEDLRTSLEHPIHMQTLQDSGGLAFVDVAGMQTGLGIIHEGRREAFAVLDVRFHVVAELYDAGITVETVEDAGLTAETTDATGTTVGTDVEELVGVKNPL